MIKRTIAAVVRKSKLGEIDETAERLAYWRAQPIEARLGAVESLRRLWIEQTGDPDLGITRVIHKRKLGDPAPKR